MMRRVVHPLLVVLALVASAIAWPRLPQRAPMHWNLAGEVDRYGSRLEAAFAMPAVMLLVLVLMYVLPRIDPRRASYAKMAGTYDTVITLTLVTLLAIHGTLLATALGYPVPMDSAIPLIIGVLLIGLGNVLPRARPNWWFGVRTPWTLSSDRVWTRTHRVAGYTMVMAGIALLLIAAIDARWARNALIVPVAAAAVIPVIYSYVAWRQETGSR